MTPVNWKEPLVAVHPDGRRVDCDSPPKFGHKTWPDESGQYHVTYNDGQELLFFNRDGSGWGNNPWRIENRAKAPAYPEGMTPEIAARMVACVEAIASLEKTSVIGRSGYASEARAIMSELEPMDTLEQAVDNAWARLPSEWSRETFVTHMTGELRKAGVTITEAKP